MSVGGLKMDITPGGLIALVLGIAIVIPIIVALFPTAIGSLVSLSTLGNFTFASFFASDGVLPLVLSAGILLGILAYVGVKVKGSRR